MSRAAGPPHPYVVEDLDDDERELLARWVTDLDGPVFCLTGLPEAVKGALFARYSRSRQSLRRLLLDEFAADLPADGHDATATSERADRLYQRVLDEYGDDSVAQLGSAHVAVEQASNLLTKVIEWGRLAAYLEQSTRYVAYDDRPGGRWRYYRDPDVMASPHAEAYTATLDRGFERYAEALRAVEEWAAGAHPRDAQTSEAAWRRALRAKACDVLRGMLPAATVSNVGVHATGQAYEHMLLRLRSHELAEARAVGDMLLVELRKVIPQFLRRVDLPDRGERWGAYLAATRREVAEVAEQLLGDLEPAGAEEVELVDWSPDADVELVTGILYPHTHLPEHQLREQVERMGAEERARAVRAFVGRRDNRRHKPGRALERVWYRFDVLGDYGAFRDLQRHRMLTVDWQRLTALHGYDEPDEVAEAGVADAYRRTMGEQHDLWRRLAEAGMPAQAQYAVGLAWRIRYSLQLNARSAMHLIELRTGAQAHPSYRRVAERMRELIAGRAGHAAVAEMLRFAGDEPLGGLERLASEARAEQRRDGRP